METSTGVSCWGLVLIFFAKWFYGDGLLPYPSIPVLCISVNTASPYYIQNDCLVDIKPLKGLQKEWIFAVPVIQRIRKFFGRNLELKWWIYEILIKSCCLYDPQSLNSDAFDWFIKRIDVAGCYPPQPLPQVQQYILSSLPSYNLIQFQYCSHPLACG